MSYFIGCHPFRVNACLNMIVSLVLPLDSILTDVNGFLLYDNRENYAAASNEEEEAGHEEA